MRKTATAERIFQANPDRVYNVYWQLSLWPKVLANVLEAQVEYDDGIHQYFTMVVDKGGKRESVRGIRIGEPCRKIELCHFGPPPGFLIMRGEWHFELVTVGAKTGTRVSVERSFEMEHSDREAATVAPLETALAENLLAFDTYLSKW
jgi:hypothetical protein